MQAPEFTLTAGPTMASDRVRAALGSPVLFDYDPVFLERFRQLERDVAELLYTDKDVVLMQGEAVLGLEAVAKALTTRGTKWLNLVSGVYAAWFGDDLRALGAEVVEHVVPYDEAIDAADVRRLLTEHPDVERVAIVHSETPSGIENPLHSVGEAVHEHGALLVADVVSAFAGTDVRVDDWHVDVCVAGPQKCLAGPPGMSLIVVSPRAWEAIAANPDAPRGSFVSLLDWKERWVDTDRSKFIYTPSVCDVNGVAAAVREVIDCGGIEASIARHAVAARAARAGVKALGLELWARDEAYAASCVTAVRCPEGVTTGQVLAHIRERYGVMLSKGYGELADKLVRLGHMGPAARSLYPVVAVTALGRGLADLGVAVDVGAGAAAAAETISAGQAELVA
ncbi:MAG TPA: alanine--glyoxylate aminotransferase family protein [Conexibacter sp.]|jgi:pyridoxamine--pyruvate transaminase